MTRPTFTGTCQVCLAADGVAYCEHGKPVCAAHDVHPSQDCGAADPDSPVTDAIAVMRRDLEYGDPPEFVIRALLEMADQCEGFERFQITTALREFTQEPTYPCPTGRHGEQEIESQGSGRGFAGGRIYWVNLACGCVDMDESDDVRAAM